MIYGGLHTLKLDIVPVEAKRSLLTSRWIALPNQLKNFYTQELLYNFAGKFCLVAAIASDYAFNLNFYFF